VSGLGGSPLSGGSVWATIAAGSGAAWVADRKNLQVVRIDPTSSSRAGEVEDLDPQSIVVDGDSLWVIDDTGGQIVEIDVQSATVVNATPFDIDSTPKALAVGFATVWAADTNRDQLLLIRPPSTAIASSIPVDDGPAALMIADESVWVGHWSGESVSRIDPHSRTVVATLNLGRNVGSLTAGGGYVWAAVT
jgi:DNA-binding beta-propeller fold protein YncE